MRPMLSKQIAEGKEHILKPRSLKVELRPYGKYEATGKTQGSNFRAIASKSPCVSEKILVFGSVGC